MTTETYEEEDAVLASVMEEATGHLRKLMPASLYKKLRYDVGLMVDLHPELGRRLNSMRHADTVVDVSGPLDADEETTTAKQKTQGSA